jgi:hypothetical protein
MLVIDCSWRKTTHTYSAASTTYSPLPSPVTEVVLDCWDRYDWRSSSDALTAWINARWKKTGFEISREVVCFTLRMHGRDAKMGLGDHLGAGDKGYVSTRTFCLSADARSRRNRNEYTIRREAIPGQSDINIASANMNTPANGRSSTHNASSRKSVYTQISYHHLTWFFKNCNPLTTACHSDPRSSVPRGFSKSNM